jgi:hypothetical protein
MRTSAHLIDPIIIETHQDLKSEKRMRSLEPVDTEKALAIEPLLVLVDRSISSASPTSHRPCSTHASPDPEAPLTGQCQQPGKPRHRMFGD